MPKHIKVEPDPMQDIEQPVKITIEASPSGAYPWEQYGDWCPKDGEQYYYIRSSGVVASRNWDEHIAVHHGRLYMGNVFKTAEDADLALLQIKRLLKR